MKIKNQTYINKNNTKFQKKLVRVFLIVIIILMLFSNTAFAQRDNVIAPKDKEPDSSSEKEDKLTDKEKGELERIRTEIQEWKRTKLLPDDIEEHLISGIAYLYNLKFEEAEDEFIAVVNLAPDKIYGYVYLTALSWIKLYIDPLDQRADTELNRLLAKSIEIGEKAISKKDAGSYDYLLYALAKTISVRSSFKSGNYPAAILHLFSALKLLSKASEFKDGNIDVQFGLGLYNAYTSSLPDYVLFFLRQVTKIKSNVGLGIKQLKNVMKNGTVFKMESVLLMVNIEGLFYNNYNKGRTICLALFEEYPLNMINNFMLIDLESRHSKYQRALSFSNTLMKVINEDITNHDRKQQLMQRVRYQIGKAHFENKKYELAEEVFEDIIKRSDIRYKYDTKYSSTDDINTLGAYFRLGMLYDLENKRNKALEYYNIVINGLERTGIVSTMKDYAVKFIKEKYVEDDKRIRIKSYQEYYIP